MTLQETQSRILLRTLADHANLIMIDQQGFENHINELLKLIEDYRNFIIAYGGFTKNRPEEEKYYRRDLLKRTHALIGGIPDSFEE